MRRVGESADVSPIPPSLFAFKPRQVILAERRNCSTSMGKNQPDTPAQSKPEQDSILTYSIALWLENKGFSKVLKRFLSTAQIQDDDWRAKALNLDEIFSKYQTLRKDVREELNPEKKQEDKLIGLAEVNGDVNGVALGDTQSKKKKKKSKDEVAVADSGRTDELPIKDPQANGKEEKILKTSDIISHGKHKNKEPKESNDGTVNEVPVDESTKIQKEKKKKKSKLTVESSDDHGKQISAKAVTEENHEGLLSKIGDNKNDHGVRADSKVDKKKKKSKDSVVAVDKDCDLGSNNTLVAAKDSEDGDNKSKKASKKRKRVAPDEEEKGQEAAVEESKPKKSKGLEEGKDSQAKISDLGVSVHANSQNKEEKSAAHDDENIKDDLTKGADTFSLSISGRKQRNGSTEPKTVNAFQRVKIEEVKFADERLQDNSYWAKAGAETGYGAKAQEVLGQVKGRDFRHEKTKKKRGSYRGGQIDLQSHSIKFDNSDDE